MHEDDRHRSQPTVIGGLQSAAGLGRIECADHTTIGRQALIDLNDFAIQPFGQHDPAVKQTRSMLIGNPQGVTKAGRHHQCQRLPLALKQRIGRHGGAHLDGSNLLGWQVGMGRYAQQAPDAFDGRILVLLGMLREQLGGDQLAIRTLANHIREGAPPVDPELPAGGSVRGGQRCGGRAIGHGKSEVPIK